MKVDIEERIKLEAKYIINSGSTVRETAKAFGVSKSTIHKDMTKKLSKINYDLFCKVEKVLQINLIERAIRGGEATRIKYLNN